MEDSPQFNLCPCLTKRYTIKTYGGVEVLLHAFLTLILVTWRIWWAPNNASKWQMGFNSAFKSLTLEADGDWCSVSRPHVFYPRRKRLLHALNKSWVDRKAGLDILQTRKICSLCRVLNRDISVVQPAAMSVYFFVTFRLAFSNTTHPRLSKEIVLESSCELQKRDVSG